MLQSHERSSATDAARDARCGRIGGTRRHTIGAPASAGFVERQLSHPTSPDRFLGRPMKVKGPAPGISGSYRSRAALGGRQLAPVASVSAGRRSTGTIRPVFGCAGSAPAAAGVLAESRVGVRLAGGRESMTCRRAGVWARGPAARLALRGPDYARPGVTLAPAFAGAAGLPFSGLAACQSETIRL